MEWEILSFSIVGFYALSSYLFRIPFQIPYAMSVGSRDSRLDQLRGISMVGIVCIHIHSYFEFFHPNERHVTDFTLFIANLSRFSVPLFIVGSSMYLKVNEYYWRNKLKTLLIPYTIACIFGYLMKFSTISILDFLIRFLTGQIFAPFYFVPLLFQFYILFYFIPDSWKKGRSLTIFFLVSIVLNFISNLDGFQKYLPQWYQSISIFNYIGFFAIGLFLKNIRTHKLEMRDITFYILTISFLILITLVFVFSLSQIQLKNHHLTYPLVTIFLLFLILNKEPIGILANTLEFLGKQSLYIFLIHPFVIHQMHVFDPFWMGPPAIAYFVTLVINLAIPALIAYLITNRKEIFSSSQQKNS